MWAVFQVFVAFCADTQYVLSSERGSHIECALEICPALDASLACIPDEEVNAVIAELKVFVLEGDELPEYVSGEPGVQPEYERMTHDHVQRWQGGGELS